VRDAISNRTDAYAVDRIRSHIHLHRPRQGIVA
jgi:hypothetical protein